MARPPIELEWGGGKWKRGQRKAVRPHVEAALTVATDGLEDLGIGLNGPKIARVWRAGRNYHSQGAAIDDRVMEVYVSAEDVKRDRVARRLPGITSTSFHELIHLVRYRSFPHETLLEITASEGLAWVATSMFGARFPAFMDDERMQTLIHPDDVADEDALFDEFLEGVFDEQTGNRSHSDLYEEWLYDPSGYLPAGITLGILAIQRALEGGHSIADLLEVPAHELLGIEV